MGAPYTEMPSFFSNQMQNQMMVQKQAAAQMQSVGGPPEQQLICQVLLVPVPAAGLQQSQDSVYELPSRPAEQLSLSDLLAQQQPQQGVRQPEQWHQHAKQRQPMESSVDPRESLTQRQTTNMWGFEGTRGRWGDMDDDEPIWRGRAPIPQADNVHELPIPPPPPLPPASVPLDTNRCVPLPAQVARNHAKAQWDGQSQRGGSRFAQPVSNMNLQQSHRGGPLATFPCENYRGGPLATFPCENMFPTADQVTDFMLAMAHSRQPAWHGASQARERGRPRGGTREPLIQDHCEAPSAAEGPDTMKVQLQALQLEDPATVFIARRINRLGFQSAKALREHFSAYGPIKEVHVSHSRVKNLRANARCKDLATPQWRLRPAALAFVVMTSPEATARILADGPEHCVKGVNVRLQAFHHQAPDAEQLGHEEVPDALHLELEANVASIVDEPTQNTDDEDYATWAKRHPRSLSPGSDDYSPESCLRTTTLSPDSGKSTSASVEDAGGAAAFLAEVARCRRLEQASAHLQANQTPTGQDMAKTQCQQAVEAEMELLYNSFIDMQSRTVGPQS